MLEAYAQHLKQTAWRNRPGYDKFAENDKATVRTIYAATALPGTYGHVNAPVENTSQDNLPYTMDELNLALSDLNKNKACIQGPYAALMVTCTQARRLLLGLLNLSRCMHIIATIWAYRMVGPQRKKGPWIVRDVKCLRPISQAASMAALVDGLWLKRCKKYINSHTGPSQFGGKTSAVFVVLTLMLTVQLRQFLGFSTLALFGDLSNAFDDATHDGMLLEAFLAGITGTEWMLMYDFLRMDAVSVAMFGVTCAMFKLQVGTGQGRKYSMHGFVLLMSKLQRIVNNTCPQAAAVLPNFAFEALEESKRILPTVPCFSRLAAPDTAQAAKVATKLKEYMDSENIPWVRTRQRAPRLLATLPDEGTRVLALEILGSHKFGPHMFVDDLTSLLPSAAAVSQVRQVAFTQYETETGSLFNDGIGKTCCMGFFCEVLTGQVGVPVVLKHKLLGFMLDSQLLGCDHLDFVQATASTEFQTMYYCAETRGFGILVTALLVMTRVQPAVIFGAILLVAADGMVARMNKMQCSWAKQILGCKHDESVSGRMAMKLLGWSYRLSSIVWEEAIVTRARAQLRPEDCPVRQLLAIAAREPAYTWESVVTQYMRSDGKAIPDLAQSDWCSEELLAQGYAEPSVGKMLVQKYRREVVRPALMEADRLWFAEKLNEFIPGTEICFRDLHGELDIQPQDLLQLEYHIRDWKAFRIWAVFRSSGCFPGPGLGGQEYGIKLLERCPLCGKGNAHPSHVLLDCKCTAAIFRNLGLESIYPGRRPRSDCLKFLLTFTGNFEALAANVKYVGDVFQAVLGKG